MYEIERKYLAKPTIRAFLAKHRLTPHRVVQFYTVINNEKSVRYRKLGSKYYKTVKKGSGGIREEREIEISKKRYKKMKKKHIGKIIRKNRYTFVEKGLHYDIDIYHGELAGLHTIEVEFPDQTSFQNFQLPDPLQSYLLEDLTLDERYKNKNLALHGIPSEHFTAQILPTMYEMDIEALEHFLVGNLNTADALRVILYKFALSILHYEALILQRDEPEDLHQFRVNLRRSRAFLKSFSACFEPVAYNDIYQTLSDVAAQTNHARDLDVIAAQLSDQKSKSTSTLPIEQEREAEREKIRAMLQSQYFRDFFNDYLAALRSGTLMRAETHTQAIKTEASAVLTALHRKICKHIDKEEKHFDPTQIHKIRISFKKLRYLLEEFEELLGKKRVARYIQEGKRLQTLLGDYNDAITQIALLKNYASQHKEIKMSNKKLIKQRKKRAKKLLKKVQKGLHKFKKKRFVV